MFLASQLIEISQCFQPDVEDLQVLLQEEEIPVRSAECLQELSNRLESDPRFRRDVGFLIRSMLGRERDEFGSMEALGVLVVAAAGTHQPLDTPVQQQLMRELLRFVIQQRRPAAAAAMRSDAVEAERPIATATGISPQFATRPELPLPAPPMAAAPEPVVVPPAPREAEPFSRRAPAGFRSGWIAAMVALLVIVVAGLLIRRDDSKATTRQISALAPAPSAASPASPVAGAPADRAILPSPPQSTHTSRKPLRRAVRPHSEPPEATMPVTVAANTPKMVERAEPSQAGPKLNPMSPSMSAPARPRQELAVVSPPAGVARQRSASGSADVSKVFAHPDAAAAQAESQVPPPVFHPKDPVLIARNSPPAAAVKPEVQGTVHIGSTGPMASGLIYSPEPAYPAQAIAGGVQGQVKVRAVVGPHGNVIDASIVSGPPLLREAALDAVGRWRFRPYEQDGEPVTIATTAILDFEIPSRK
jgi:TonB family protein